MDPMGGESGICVKKHQEKAENTPDLKWLHLDTPGELESLKAFGDTEA